MPDSPEECTTRRSLIALCLFSGLGASASGIAFVLRPDGSLHRAPFSLLQHTSFPDFLVPGILLWALVGLSNLVAAAALVSLKRPLGETLSFLGGATVTGFIVGEMLLVQRMNWLQILHLAVGLATMAQALALRTRRQRLLHEGT
jgi:hypothetical protein